MGRKFLLLLGALELESSQAVDRNTIQAIVVVFFESLGLVVVIIGSAAATSISIFAIEQALVGVDRGQVVSSSLDGGSGVGYQMIPNMGKRALHVDVVVKLLAARMVFLGQRINTSAPRNGGGDAVDVGSTKTPQNHPKASATHLQLLFFRYGTRMEAQGRLGSEWESDWELQIAGKAHIIARKNAPERERGRMREKGSEAGVTVGQ